MKRNYIKNIIVSLVFILVMGMATFAMPSTPSNLDFPNQILNDADKTIDKETYELASTMVRANINIVNSQIKEYTDYQESVREKTNKLNSNENIENISEEDLIKAKELIKQLPRQTKKNKVVAADDSVGILEKNEEYYKALEKLNMTLVNKQTQLLDIEKNINIWQQIDALID